MESVGKLKLCLEQSICSCPLWTLNTINLTPPAYSQRHKEAKNGNLKNSKLLIKPPSTFLRVSTELGMQYSCQDCLNLWHGRQCLGHAVEGLECGKWAHWQREGAGIQRCLIQRCIWRVSWFCYKRSTMHLSKNTPSEFHLWERKQKKTKKPKKQIKHPDTTTSMYSLRTLASQIQKWCSWLGHEWGRKSSIIIYLLNTFYISGTCYTLW